MHFTLTWGEVGTTLGTETRSTIFTHCIPKSLGQSIKRIGLFSEKHQSNIFKLLGYKNRLTLSVQPMVRRFHVCSATFATTSLFKNSRGFLRISFPDNSFVC